MQRLWREGVEGFAEDAVGGGQAVFCGGAREVEGGHDDGGFDVGAGVQEQALGGGWVAAGGGGDDALGAVD